MKSFLKKIFLFGLLILFPKLFWAEVFEPGFSPGVAPFDDALSGFGADETAGKTTGADSLSVYYQKALASRKLGELIVAKNHFKKAVALLKQYENPSPEMAYHIYLNFGSLNIRLGNMTKALELYNRAEQQAIDAYGKNHNSTVAVYIGEGIVYRRLGNMAKAKKHFDRALHILNRQPDKNYRWLAYLYNNLGALHYKQGEYEKSLEAYFMAWQMKKEYGCDALSTCVNIAMCYEELEGYEEAERYYKKCIDETIEKHGGTYFKLGRYYMSYAIFLMKTGQNEQALAGFFMAYEVYLKNFGLQHPATALCLRNIGDYYFSTNSYTKALEYYQKALTSELEGYNNAGIYSNPDMQHPGMQLATLNTLKHKANALFRLYSNQTRLLRDLQFSLSTYELCLAVINRIRIGYVDQENRFALAKNQTDTYNRAIEAALELHKQTADTIYRDKAFRFAELSKSASLMASLRDISAKNIGGIPHELQEQEKEIKQTISNLNGLIYREREKQKPNNEKIAKWQNELFRLSEEYENLIKTFEKDYPRYHALKYDDTTVPAHEIQAKLPKNKMVLEYVIADSALYTFAITNNHFAVITQPINRQEFEDKIETVRKTLKTREFSNKSYEYYKRYVVAAHELYRYLIKPVAHLAKDKTLVVIPDGKLGYIPFGVLLTQPVDTARMAYGNLPYLLRKNSFAYLNSATIFHHRGEKKKKSYKYLLGFAPGYNNVSDSMLYNNHSRQKKLYPLPYARKEVKEVGDIITGDLFVDREATEENFKKNASNYDLLHLAMHTIIDDQDPMFSKLVFSPQNDSINDGLLHTYEIYNMDLNSRMVVLSACNTGDGKLMKGEGIMSLARAFLYAGCSGIIMTLWTVEDESGSILMPYFYRFLAKGMTKDQALRAAKLKYLENADSLKSHPYFWAGYVSMGDVSPLYENWWLIFSKYAVLFLIFSVIFYFLFKKKPAPGPKSEED